VGTTGIEELNCQERRGVDVPHAHRVSHGRLRRLLAVESRLRQPEGHRCVLTSPTSLEMSPRIGLITEIPNFWTLRGSELRPDRFAVDISRINARTLVETRDDLSDVNSSVSRTSASRTIAATATPQHPICGRQTKTLTTRSVDYGELGVDGPRSPGAAIRGSERESQRVRQRNDDRYHESRYRRASASLIDTTRTSSSDVVRTCTSDMSGNTRALTNSSTREIGAKGAGRARSTCLPPTFRFTRV
jgi:hypothetical protein